MRVAEWVAVDCHDSNRRHTRTSRGVVSMCAHDELPVIAVAINDGTVRVLQIIPMVKRVSSTITSQQTSSTRTEQCISKMYFVQVNCLGGSMNRLVPQDDDETWNNDFEEEVDNKDNICNQYGDQVEHNNDDDEDDIGGVLQLKFLNHKTRTPTCYIAVVRAAKAGTYCFVS